MRAPFLQFPKASPTCYPYGAIHSLCKSSVRDTCRFPTLVFPTMFAQRVHTAFRLCFQQRRVGSWKAAPVAVFTPRELTKATGHSLFIYLFFRDPVHQHIVGRTKGLLALRFFHHVHQENQRRTRLPSSTLPPQQSLKNTNLTTTFHGNLSVATHHLQIIFPDSFPHPLSTGHNKPFASP